MGVPFSPKHSAELLAGCFGLKGAPTSSFIQSLSFKGANAVCVGGHSTQSIIEGNKAVPLTQIALNDDFEQLIQNLDNEINCFNGVTDSQGSIENLRLVSAKATPATEGPHLGPNFKNSTLQNLEPTPQCGLAKMDHDPVQIIAQSEGNWLLIQRPTHLKEIQNFEVNLGKRCPPNKLDPPKPPKRRAQGGVVVSPRDFLGNDALVSVLIDRDHHGWVTDAIDSIFLPHDSSLIKAIPFSLNDCEDKIFWPHNADGSYSVRSGYRLLSEDDSKDSPSVSDLAPTKRLWKGIWGLKVPNRVKTFMWRAGTDSLPSKMNLLKRKVLSNDLCPDCKLESESSFHALWTCRVVALVWKCKFEWLRKLTVRCNSFLDVIKLCQDHNGLLDLFAMTGSLLWSRRN
nr:putative ribonuclease h protein [Quercus suber]